MKSTLCLKKLSMFLLPLLLISTVVSAQSNTIQHTLEQPTPIVKEKAMTHREANSKGSIEERLLYIEQSLAYAYQDLLQRLETLAQSPDRDTAKMQQTKIVLEQELKEVDAKAKLLAERIKEYRQTGVYPTLKTKPLKE